MPREAVAVGAVDEVLTLADIPARVVARLNAVERPARRSSRG
jgi:chemotaxis response regulator CheB